MAPGLLFPHVDVTRVHTTGLFSKELYMQRPTGGAPVMARLGVKITLAVLLIMTLPAICLSAPEMSDYCYIPPFVTDSNTPPNILVVYEKGSAILKRAYAATYAPDKEFYGFFDPSSAYAYNTTGNYFEKASCTPSGTSLNCYYGNLLNWAMMSSLDLSRKALVGFGWPDPGSGSGAGIVFTYTGNFNGNLTPISYGQWSDGNSLAVSATLNLGGSNYSYTFCLSKTTGSNPTGLGIRVKSGTSAPACSGSTSGVTVITSSGQVAMKFTNEKRYGVIQEFVDKNQDYTVDIDGARYAMRRWNNGADKQADIIMDSPVPTTADRAEQFKNLLTAVSKAPPDDSQTAYLDSMMKDIVSYVSGASASYVDNNGYSQTPYNWATDPARKCRKTFALYITTGAYLNDTGVGPLSTTCSSGADSTDFSQNTCYAYVTDLYAADTNPAGKQNIRTVVVHTSFYGGGAANAGKLKYAASAGGGEYIEISDPAAFESILRQTILNIIASASSASTVATLTSQTRESSTITQAYFYPKQEDTPLRWVGHLRLLWSDVGANIREDTANAGWLDLKKDKILSFFYDDADVKYKARQYAALSTFPYDTIASCNPTASGNSTATNEQILAIWNAQDKLRDRADDRTIKVGLGDSSGVVSSGTCSGSSGFCSFTTALNTTLQPFWNAGGYCSNNSSRWCSVNSDCNYCSNNVNRGCPSSTNAECNYCSGNIALACSGTPDCVLNYGTCQLSTKYCTSNLNTACTADSECTGTCVANVCSNNAGRSCTVDADCAGTCQGTCSGNTFKSCLADAGCIEDYGTCTTSATCTTGGTCNAECDSNCATSVIKFVRGYDKPSPSGGQFRIRHQCTANTDCPSGQTCGTDKLCTGSDVLKTLKLGDVVYSTPRMSPNAAVNGYDSIYGDDTYKQFLTNTMGSVTPIALVGANDGMLHAFKVGKIKDIDPAMTTGGGVTDGYQTARFSNDPSDTSETAPPTDLGKELWAYIPYNAVPFLKWYCQTGYCHIPMVDARFTIVDASIEGGTATDTRTENSWRRLLIGAMGIGGKEITIGNVGSQKTLSSSIFVLDITDPLNPSFLWERSLPDRSLTTAVPAVVRLQSTISEMAKNENGSWYIAIGSGPKSVQTTNVTYKTDSSSIFILDLRTGNVITTLAIPDSTGTAVGDMMAVDYDKDYQVDAIYFGTYGGTGSSPTGKLYRMRVRNGANAYFTDPSTDAWPISVMINHGRPMFASPEIAVDHLDNVWIYFGTGLYLSIEHASQTTADEWMYGVKETEACWMGSGACSTYATTSFLDVSGITFTGAQAKSAGCYCGGAQLSIIECNPAGTCTGSCGDNKACSNNRMKTCSADAECPGGSCIENKVVLKVTDPTIGGTGVPGTCSGKTGLAAIECVQDVINASYQGWKRKVTGQKLFARPFVAGGLVDFTSFEPVSTVCSLGGNTYLISVHYTTGTPYVQPSLAMAEATSGTFSNLTLNAAVKLGTGVPPLGESLVALPLSGDSYKVITQVSGGLPGIEVAPSVSMRTGYILWRVR